MWLRGYDAWKTREPDPDADYICETCGYPLCTGNGNGWFCERCDMVEPEWEPDPEDRSCRWEELPEIEPEEP